MAKNRLGSDSPQLVLSFVSLLTSALLFQSSLLKLAAAMGFMQPSQGALQMCAMTKEFPTVVTVFLFVCNVR